MTKYELKKSQEKVGEIVELKNITDMQKEVIISLKEEVNGLKDDLKEQKFCYELAASRAKRYKSQLTIIKEALAINSNQGDNK